MANMELGPIPKPAKRGRKAPKPIPQRGPVTNNWLSYRRQWLIDNPPDYRGYWICWICGQPVDEYNLELDHVENRSTNPELRFDDKNIKPSHRFCNGARKMGVIIKSKR